MRVKKLLALTLAMILILGTFTFGFGIENIEVQQFTENAKIFITADDGYELYVDGNLIGSEGLDTSGDEQQWDHLDEYWVDMDIDDYLVAVYAEDRFGEISGLTVTIQFNDGEQVIAEHLASEDNGWVKALEEYDGWYEVDYTASEDLWEPVTDIDDPHDNWVVTNPSTLYDPSWIWSDVYDTPMDTPVWFRSEAPEEEPVYYNITTFEMPTGSGITYGDGDYEEGDAVTVSAVAAPGYIFVNWVDLSGTTPTGVSTNPEFGFIMPDHDLVLVANFREAPQETGILTIEKEVWIDGVEDTDNERTFNFYVEGESATASGIFSVTTPAQVELPVGTYIVTESGYGDFMPDSVTKQAIVTTEGGFVEFENTYRTPEPGTYSITVNKDVIGTATDTEFEVAIYPWMDQIIPIDEFYGPVRIDLPLLDEGNGSPPPYATTGTIIEGDPFVVNGLEPGDYWVSENPEIEGFYTPPDQLVGIDNENVEVTITNYQYPEIEIEKTVDDTSVRVNEDVTYTITVTNLGGFYLPEVVVEDSQLGFTTTTALDIGESESFEIETSYSSTGDKVNTATASALVAVIEGDGELYSMHPDELPITHQLPVLDIFELEVSDSATVNVSRRSTPSRDYEMELEKEADGDFYEVGDTITYTITIENTGDTRLTDIVIEDDMTGFETTLDYLNPGESREFTTTYVAQESDIGDLTNTATAEDDRAGTEEDDVTVTVEGVPEGVPEYTMTIVKTAMTEGEIFSGDMVEFTIVVTNTGDETITDILVEDDMVDFEAVIDELEPGESEEFTVMVEAPDIPGPFTNTAKATSTETGTQQADDTVFVEEPVPLDVPDTGVAPTDLFFGLGALVSGLGVFFTKKRK